MTEPPHKRDVAGVMAKLLHHTDEKRGMTMTPFASRCVRAGELHELVTSDHDGFAPGSQVDRVGFLGFVEIRSGGVIDVGDLLTIAGRPVGKVIGFDDCHFPNHYNVLVGVPELRTADLLSLAVEDEVVFRSTAESVRT